MVALYGYAAQGGVISMEDITMYNCTYQEIYLGCGLGIADGMKGVLKNIHIEPQGSPSFSSFCQLV